MIDKQVLEYSKQLKELGIGNEIVEHPELKTPSETLGYLGFQMSEGGSTLIMKADDIFIAFIRRDDCKIDSKKLKDILNVKNLRIASPDEYTSLTGLPIGAARIYEPHVTKTLIDKKILEKEYVIGGSGSFNQSIKYRASDLRKLPNSEVVDAAEVIGNKGKKHLMTGFTPTGKLHLGHFVGNLENLLSLKTQYDEFLLLADTHALTTLHKDPSIVKEHVLSNLLDLLSVGLSETEVTYYLESEIPEIYELASLFSMYVTHARALRNPTIKDEIKMKGLGEQFSLGFVNYPMYQAADILCVKGELVPVGKDQEAHLEQTREIVETFNKLAGKEIFPYVKTLIGRVGKLIGTDGNPKMSKSLGNTIYLSATEEEMQKQVMNMYTDPTRKHATDPGHTEGNPVFEYLGAFGKDTDKDKIGEYKEAYREGQVGDVEVKKYLIEILNNFMSPIRERRKKYDNKETLLEILKKGTQRTRKITQETLNEVREAIGFIY